jgi:hypothetical protein
MHHASHPSNFQIRSPTFHFQHSTTASPLHFTQSTKQGMETHLSALFSSWETWTCCLVVLVGVFVAPPFRLGKVLIWPLCFHSIPQIPSQAAKTCCLIVLVGEFVAPILRLGDNSNMAGHSSYVTVCCLHFSSHSFSRLPSKGSPSAAAL